MSHFTSFTADKMAAFRQALEDGQAQRSDSIERLRQATSALLAEARRSQAAAEHQRRTSAAREAGARRDFAGELRKSVTAMKDDFRGQREAIAADLRAMAEELGAARAAFHGGRR